MSELQIGLLVVGAVIVAAVFLYNKWQERRYRREAEAGFASQREDVLMRSGGGAGQGTAPGLERLEPLVSFEAEQEDPGDSGAGGSSPSYLSRPSRKIPGIRGRGCRSFWTSSFRSKPRRKFPELP